MALDPDRYVRAELSNPEHRLPMPNGRLFDPNGQLVDLHDPTVIALLKDRSIVRREAPVPLDEPVEEVRAAVPEMEINQAAEEISSR